MANGKLPAAERIVILTGRIANLTHGAGDFPRGNKGCDGPRQKAIRQAESALADAKADLAKETAH